ncbi:hypothetical protein SpiGrapes_0143 [Sphaerochaeta pleomorpha str. Grapes]|uniref:Alginate export domain-containing protein n=1 Tax=Sphaerochaeta pleomorpha (strain ATCC BAA-1885 / DSM 22778 / Grapes) TaxID=158190 RepID=G8QTP2_SPHPG|nr:DUF1302 family protein [Sphaerochaeta pleomorpha]AEV28007.1 hypothetical protein SpiGrapes_0143 [Sphaerochaeta pleomorpha str. Grapes]
MTHFKKTLIVGMAGVLLLQGSIAFADDSFGSFFDSMESTELSSSASSSALTINGYADLTSRAYVSKDNTLNSNCDYYATMVDPSVRLDFTYDGTDSEMRGKLLFRNDPTEILDELTYKAFLGDFVVEAGKSKIVWGRGDNLHVLDLFNANDYSDFLIPDYLDRRISEDMLQVTWNMSNALSLEAVWTPSMTADKIPTSGIWAPAAGTQLVTLGTSYVTNLAKTAYSTAYNSAYAAVLASSGTAEAAAATAALAGVSAASAITDTYSSASDFLPDTNSLKYSQYGLRLTGSYGPVDFGAQYYLGHYKTPSVSYTANATGVTDFNLSYDRLQVFGIDGAGVLGRCNLRGEVAYYLTEDIDGDDASVHNNSLQYLAGFDTNLPYNEMNLNVQLIGSYIFNNDKISSSSDMDYNAAGKYLTDKLVLQFSDSYNHAKAKPSISVIWGIEQKDLIVMPKFEYQLKDGFMVTALAFLFTSDEDGEFAAYANNDFIQVQASYSF